MVIRTLAFLWVVGASCAVATPGCGKGIEDYDCNERARCDDHGDSCMNPCVPAVVPDSGWQGPGLVQEADSENDLQGCPGAASQEQYVAYQGLHEASLCPECACDEPSCVLPAGITASSLAVCQDGPGATLTAFEPAAGWDGTCASPAVLPPARVASIAIAPTTVRACEPVLPALPVPNAAPWRSPWDKAARVCWGMSVEGICRRNTSSTCFPPYDEKPEDWTVCIWREGEQRCPPAYPDKRVYYQDFDPSTGCAACTCEQTTSSRCEALVSSYQDAECTDILASAMVADIAFCHDPGRGVTLGSMSATWRTNEPGSCTAGGGGPMGEMTPTQPLTVCCLVEDAKKR